VCIPKQQTYSFYMPVFKTGRIMVYQCPTVRPSVPPFHMSHSNLRTPWPIHFKFHRVIGIDGLTVCILYGEISNFHSRVMGLYSSNCRRFFLCRTVNWEPLGQFTSNFAQLLELIVLRSVYFLVKFRLLYPRSPKGEGGILFYLCPSIRPSKIFFIAFFSVTVDGRNLIFGRKCHIGIPYCG
jgi:hypothetical protein